MARLQIIYDMSDDIEEIIKAVEDHVNFNKDEAVIFNLLQVKFQAAFDEGRKFQKHLKISSDSRLFKTTQLICYQRQLDMLCLEGQIICPGVVVLCSVFIFEFFNEQNCAVCEKCCAAPSKQFASQEIDKKFTMIY